KAGHMEKLEGPIEADETFIGGKAKNRTNYQDPRPFGRRRKSKGPGYGKTAVMGMVQRHGGQVRAMRIWQRTAKTLQRQIEANVKPGATIYTDAFPGYNILDTDYIHYV